MSKSVGAIVYAVGNRVRADIGKSRFKRAIIKNTPIIVYQMGKVGSSSIYNSLKKAYPGEVIHRHELNEPGDWQAEILLAHASVHKKPLKLISLIREPIGRNISAFFQNFELITGIDPKHSTYTPGEIKHILLTSTVMDNTVPLWWFDKNTLQNFGIDVYAQPFDKDKGWTKLKNGNTELLLMKAEIDDTLKTQLVKEFTGLREFTLSAFNVSESKEYADIYSAFKKDITLPDDYLNMLYNAPQVRHFYTDREIEKYSTRWRKQ